MKVLVINSNENLSEVLNKVQGLDINYSDEAIFESRIKLHKTISEKDAVILVVSKPGIFRSKMFDEITSVVSAIGRDRVKPVYVYLPEIYFAIERSNLISRILNNIFRNRIWVAAKKSNKFLSDKNTNLKLLSNRNLNSKENLKSDLNEIIN